MKKVTYLAAAALVGATIITTPLQVMAAGPVQVQNVGSGKAGNVKIFAAGNIASSNIESLKDYLENCQPGNMQIITIPCLPGNWPGAGTPEAPETDKPEVEAPETDAPEIDVPDIDVPEADQPETDAPETNVPEVELPETNQPGISTPENNNPDTSTPETNTPGTENPGEEDSTQSVHPYVLRIVELVNEERAKAGLNPLTLQENVTEAAQVRAIECETLFSHTRPNGTSFSTALKEAGVSYRGAGENIAWGQKTPEQVMEGWMNSSGHRANILNDKYTTIGVGYYQNANGTNYWCQLFTY